MGREKLSARELDFRRIHGPYELVFMPISGRGFALFRTSVSSEKGLTLITDDFFSVIKIRWTLLLVGFSYAKKSTNALMWKDKDYKNISSA